MKLVYYILILICLLHPTRQAFSKSFIFNEVTNILNVQSTNECPEYLYQIHDTASSNFDAELVKTIKYKIGIIPIGLIKPTHQLTGNLKPFSYGLFAEANMNKNISISIQSLNNLAEKHIFIGPGIKFQYNSIKPVRTFLQVDVFFAKQMVGDYFYNSNRFTEWIVLKRFSMACMPSIGTEVVVDKKLCVSVSGGTGFEFWSRVNDPNSKFTRIEASEFDYIYYPYLFNLFIQLKLGICL